MPVNVHEDPNRLRPSLAPGDIDQHPGGMLESAEASRAYGFANLDDMERDHDRTR